MTGELIGILIGSLIALAGTFITSVVAIVMSKEQYKQELRKAFIQKKVDAYTHVCQVILAIKNDLLTKTVSSAGLNWTAQSINELADVCITEGLWIDEEDSKKLEVLQKQLSKFVFDEIELSRHDILTACYEIVEYCEKKVRILHSMTTKE
ncbi:hypothetical protein H8R29_12530 [Priestia megaterium]|uniref:Uncharacterized protein n=2 Tax=Priestia megaterium TaxID=1404 RepID=A0A6M6DVU4_PRIMG|nr:hypothetical protein [Priestia megaterium]AJI21903.1 hypothetical protein BG04_4796 [Priestia megaterium NBRC 15308 = ATCC 14581]KFM98266.1 hypothetical protein DJ91_473 [Priestia megaterium]KGJ74076.1 hypothetical protein BMT_06770 [Priestia megaterium NBRC 15308 = ATCC 14581]KLV30634.1 hypothetical protein ABW04_18145 [Priestia megaterium]MCE4090183.1 hypothetical protein [Priestia megaterium]